MRSLLRHILPALHLTRVTTAFAAVANVWFIVLWTRAEIAEPKTPSIANLPIWFLLLGSAANALGLFGFTTALNDVLDWRRDQTLNPSRPIPSGRVSIPSAVNLVVLSFGAAVLGATVLGMPAVLLTLLVAGAILFFNAAGKFIPGVGLVVLGLIYAGQMVVPNLHLRFVIPVWLVMTHTLGVAAAVYILGRKTPGLSYRAAFFSVMGWIFWSGVMFGTAWYRNSSETAAGRTGAPVGAGSSGDGGEGGGVWPQFVPLAAGIMPLILAVVFVVLVWRRTHLLGRGPRVAEKIARYGALWLSLYACAWMLGTGNLLGAAVLGVLAAAGLLGMTVVREAVAIIEQPLGYRR